MTDERFRKLYNAVRHAYHIEGAHLPERTRAKRQLHQALDLLYLEAEPEQMELLQSLQRQGYPELAPAETK